MTNSPKPQTPNGKQSPANPHQNNQLHNPTNHSHTPTQPTTRSKKLWLWIEWSIFYIIIPPLVAALTRPTQAQQLLTNLNLPSPSFDLGLPQGAIIFPALLGSFSLMFIALRLDPTFDNAQLWNTKALKSSFKRIMSTFSIFAILMVAAAYFLANHTTILPEDGFFRLPRKLPILIIAISILYPWFSAYPQEITHRAFYFHRYAPILGTGRAAFITNILCFSWLHAPMWNSIALLMTIPAGILFAHTYLKSKSALTAGFEHAIYGIWAFTTGLGYFVFAGNTANI